MLAASGRLARTINHDCQHRYAHSTTMGAGGWCMKFWKLSSMDVDGPEGQDRTLEAAPNCRRPKELMAAMLTVLSRQKRQSMGIRRRWGVV